MDKRPGHMKYVFQILLIKLPMALQFSPILFHGISEFIALFYYFSFRNSVQHRSFVWIGVSMFTDGKNKRTREEPELNTSNP